MKKILGIGTIMFGLMVAASADARTIGGWAGIAGTVPGCFQESLGTLVVSYAQVGCSAEYPLVVDTANVQDVSWVVTNGPYEMDLTVYGMEPDNESIYSIATRKAPFNFNGTVTLTVGMVGGGYLFGFMTGSTGGQVFALNWSG